MEEIKQIHTDNSSDNESENDYTPEKMFEACRDGDLAYFKKYKEHGGSIEITDFEGDTALHNAVYGKNIKLVQVLILLGSNVNAENNKGFTPLHLAVGLDQFKMAKILLEHGAIADAVSNRGTPLDLAEENNRKGMQALIKQYLSKKDPAKQVDLMTAFNEIKEKFSHLTDTVTQKFGILEERFSMLEFRVSRLESYRAERNFTPIPDPIPRFPSPYGWEGS